MYKVPILRLFIFGVVLTYWSEASSSSSSSSSDEKVRESGFYCDPNDPAPIPNSKICDRVDDCPNMVDESLCQPADCPTAGTFFCGFENCAPVSLFCDGKIDCDADEQYCLFF